MAQHKNCVKKITLTSMVNLKASSKLPCARMETVRLHTRQNMVKLEKVQKEEYRMVEDLEDRLIILGHTTLY